MKRSKKAVLGVLCLLLLAVAAGAVCIGLRTVPTVNHALRIGELLQPLLNAENQSMRIGVSASYGGSPLELESHVFLVTEEGTSYLAMEQRGMVLYVADNVLFLENGKAFKLGEKIQKQTASYADLLSRIGTLYDVLKITTKETDDSTLYEVVVTGDQVDTLLAAASLGETLPVAGIQTLHLSLTEKDGTLEKIVFSGNGKMDGASIALNVTLSDFRILAPGDYPIPNAVKKSAATVNPEELFSLTEDLFRLVTALAPLSGMESIEGTLALAVDCGPIQLDTKLQLSDLQTSSGEVDPEQLRSLPELLGLLCLEGDIRCTQRANAYVYTLDLDHRAMQQLVGMILPELSQYSGNLTEGNVEVILEDNQISSMKASIQGKLNALITQIPIGVEAEFVFG